MYGYCNVRNYEWMILGNKWVHRNSAPRVSYLIHLHIYPRPWRQGFVYVGLIIWLGCDSDSWLDYVEARCNDILGNFSKSESEALQ
jgi:hypothetical protein